MAASAAGVRMTLAPRPRMILRRSTENESAMVATKGWPVAAHTIASAIPVLPLVGSTMDLYFGGDMNASLALTGQVAGRIDEVEPVETLDRAVQRAAALAQPSDTVLLSPACASFDQYTDFEARGEHFRSLVLALRP